MQIKRKELKGQPMSNASWKISEDSAVKLKGNDMFTKGIDYVSTEDIHWDKVQVHDLTAVGATLFADILTEALNRKEGI